MNSARLRGGERLVPIRGGGCPRSSRRGWSSLIRASIGHHVAFHRSGGAGRPTTAHVGDFGPIGRQLSEREPESRLFRSSATMPARAPGGDQKGGPMPRTTARAGSRTRSSGRTPAAKVPHLSVAERAARGKAARAEVPRSRHAVFEPAADRVDPVRLLERQAESRVPELVPIRYARMLVSPFTFYRGAALIMAHDLAPTPRSGLTVQCCGDAHLSNFGVFASPERRLVFDINDFDETLPGPWEWDIKRLAVSMLIAARDNGYRVSDEERVVLDTVAGYRTAMAEFASMKNLDVWYARKEIESVIEELAREFKRKMALRAEKAVAKARTNDSMAA